MLLEKAYGQVCDGNLYQVGIALLATDARQALRLLTRPSRNLGVDALLRHCDEVGCEIIIISGPDWKVVAHPLSGCATLTETAA